MILTPTKNVQAAECRNYQSVLERNRSGSFRERALLSITASRHAKSVASRDSLFSYRQVRVVQTPAASFSTALSQAAKALRQAACTYSDVTTSAGPGMNTTASVRAN